MKFTKECFVRALRTFIQTVVGYITVNVVMINFTAERSIVKQAVSGLAVSAIAAGLSAVMNAERGEKNEV